MVSRSVKYWLYSIIVMEKSCTMLSPCPISPVLNLERSGVGRSIDYAARTCWYNFALCHSTKCHGICRLDWVSLLSKLVLISRHHPRLFKPTASAFMIALQCQPCLFLVDYLDSSKKLHPQNVIINNHHPPT